MSACGAAPRATVHCLTRCETAIASESFITPPSATSSFCAAILGSHRNNASSVPFFLYEPQSMPTFTNCNRSVHLGKHSASLLLVDALEHHPWRTRDMSLACLFIIPALLDWMVEGLCTALSDDEHVDIISRTVRPHLHRGRHVFLAASWGQVLRYGNRTASSCVHRSLPGILQAHFRHEAPCHIGLGFVTDFDLAASSAPWHRASRVRVSQPPRRISVPSISAPRPYLLEFSSGYRPAHPYRDRKQFLHAATRLDNRSIVITPSFNPQPELPANRSVLPWCKGSYHHYHYCVLRRGLSASQMLRLRTRAHFSLFMRGDDESSDRIQNAFSMLQIPLIVGEKNVNWLPFPSAIPWRRIVKVVPQAAFERDPTQAVADAADAVSPEDRNRRRELMQKHLPDLLWTARDSRAATNFLREVAAARHANCRR